MNCITPEGKKINPRYHTYFRVISTNASGQVVGVSKEYSQESSAIKRLEKEDKKPAEVPALFHTLFEYNASYGTTIRL
jgi:hypothetical protein